MNEPDKCPLCGGKQKMGSTSFTVDKGSVLIVARHVPAQVCSLCGESWIGDEIAAKLEGYVLEAERQHKQFEVIDMAA